MPLDAGLFGLALADAFLAGVLRPEDAGDFDANGFAAADLALAADLGGSKTSGIKAVFTACLN